MGNREGFVKIPVFFSNCAFPCFSILGCSKVICKQLHFNYCTRTILGEESKWTALVFSALYETKKPFQRHLNM